MTYKVLFFILFITIVLHFYGCKGKSNDYLILDYDLDKEVHFYKDVNGTPIMDLSSYDIVYTDTFRQYAFVLEHSKCYVINRKEEKLLQVYFFDNGPDYIYNGLFRIVKDGKVGFANEQMEVVIEPKYEFVQHFENGLATFCVDCIKHSDFEYEWYEGKWGCIDATGKVVIEPKYDKPIWFENGKATTLQNNTEVLLDIDKNQKK